MPQLLAVIVVIALVYFVLKAIYVGTAAVGVFVVGFLDKLTALVMRLPPPDSWMLSGFAAVSVSMFLASECRRWTISPIAVWQGLGLIAVVALALRGVATLMRSA